VEATRPSTKSVSGLEMGPTSGRRGERSSGEWVEPMEKTRLGGRPSEEPSTEVCTDVEVDMRGRGSARRVAAESADVGGGGGNGAVAAVGVPRGATWEERAPGSDAEGGNTGT
jgi:hypothetical protein